MVIVSSRSKHRELLLARKHQLKRFWAYLSYMNGALTGEEFQQAYLNMPDHERKPQRHTWVPPTDAHGKQPLLLPRSCRRFTLTVVLSRLAGTATELRARRQYPSGLAARNPKLHARPHLMLQALQILAAKCLHQLL